MHQFTLSPLIPTGQGAANQAKGQDTPGVVVDTDPSLFAMVFADFGAPADGALPTSDVPVPESVDPPEQEAAQALPDPGALESAQDTPEPPVVVVPVTQSTAHQAHEGLSAMTPQVPADQKVPLSTMPGVETPVATGGAAHRPGPQEHQSLRGSPAGVDTRAASVGDDAVPDGAQAPRPQPSAMETALRSQISHPAPVAIPVSSAGLMPEPIKASPPLSATTRGQTVEPLLVPAEPEMQFRPTGEYPEVTPILRPTSGENPPAAILRTSVSPRGVPIAPASGQVMSPEGAAMWVDPGDPDTAAPGMVELASPVDRAAAPAAPSARADMARPVAEQIATAIRVAQEGAVEVALQPEELGRVKIAISPQDGGVAIAIQAERPETLDLMRRHLEVLQDIFAEFGEASATFGTHGEWGSAAQDRQGKDATTADEPTHAGEAEGPVRVHSPGLTALSGLDIRV